MTSPPTAQLVRGGQALPANQPIPVGSDGTAVALTVAPGLELTAAALVVRMPDDSAPLELTAGAVVATDLGAVAPPADKPVRWVSYDWRARRALVRLTVTLAAGADATHVRLRLSDGGPWLLASPGPLVEVKAVGNVPTATVQLPGLSASRVMLELVVKANGALTPEDHPPATASKLASVSLTAARRPPALTVTVAGATIHHEPALLPPGAVVTVAGPGLLAALRDLLPGHVGGVAELRLVAPVESALQKLDLTLETREVVERFRGGAPALSADVPAGGELVGAVDLAAKPTRVRARLRGAARNEYRLPVAQAQTPRFAHRCTAGSALAQAFALPRGDALVGVDLLVGPRTAALKGNVAFHADDGGLPSATPFAAVALDLADLPGAGADPTPRWLPVDLRAPTAPPTPTVWIALAPTEGEALWYLGEADPQDPTRGLARRERSEPFVLRDMPFKTGPARPWACAVPRLQRATPPDPPVLRVRWAGALGPAAGEGGRLDVSAELPNPPAPPTAAPLELAVMCPFSARVELDALVVDLPASSKTLSFGP